MAVLGRETGMFWSSKIPPHMFKVNLVKGWSGKQMILGCLKFPKLKWLMTDIYQCLLSLDLFTVPWVCIDLDVYGNDCSEQLGKLRELCQASCHFYPRPVLASGYCRCLHPSICLSIRPSLRSSITKFVHAMTHHPFKLGLPNFDWRCKTPLLRSLLFLFFWVFFFFFFFGGGGNRPWPTRSNLT